MVPAMMLALAGLAPAVDPAVVWAWAEAPAPKVMVAPQPFLSYAQGLDQSKTRGLPLVTFVGSATPSPVPGALVAHAATLPPYEDGSILVSRYGVDPASGVADHWRSGEALPPGSGTGEILQLVGRPLAGAAPPPVDARVAQRSTPEASEGRPRVIKFTADWCGPCKRFAPVFEGWRGKFSSLANFQIVDIDKDPATAARYGVTRIPAVVVVGADGSVRGNLSGGSDETSLQALLEAYP